MNLKIKENSKNIEDFNLLYRAVGWGDPKNSITKKSLDNTFYSISVYDSDKIIGYGRIIGDGICYLYIQDVMVLPNYQNKKIGTLIMKKLLEKIDTVESENPDLLVYLGASKNKEGFYEKFGFMNRDKLGLGPGMVLQ